MIERRRIIGFRLTFSEEAKYLPLVRARHCTGWSDLVRLALRELFERTDLPTSDNRVKQKIDRLILPPLFDKPAKKKARPKGLIRKTRRKIAS